MISLREGAVEPIIARHGGYRKLKSFQLARLCYDVTVRFCERYVPAGSRTRDQMVQAARSGVQNIAEGSEASGTSKKTELKLTSVARASLEELRLDYEDFLRQRGLPRWPASDPRCNSLVARRCQTVDEVAAWVRGIREEALRTERNGAWDHQPGPIQPPHSQPALTGYQEIAANAALTLIRVTCALLNRQLAALSQAFADDGGFTERLHRVRSAQKRKGRVD
jgi:four helix bundle suffix protein